MSSSNGILPKEEPAALTRATTTRKQNSQIGFFRRILSVILRLAIWYSLFTAFFRCPSDLADLNPQSPRICKPYIITRTHLSPYFSPYYHRYGEPYVETLRPYTKLVQDRVYYPVVNTSTRVYHMYGAAHVERSRQYAEKQWDIHISPPLQSFKTSIDSFYDSSVGPYIVYIRSATTPHFHTVSTQLAQLRDNQLVPAYTHMKPLSDKAYASIHQFVAQTVIPYSHQCWSGFVTLFNGILRPRVAGLYFENIEPQLVRIGARLASYREGRKETRAQDENESVPANAPYSIGIITPRMSTEVSTTLDESSSSTSASVPVTTSLSPTRERAQVQIASDLKTWQEKFATAADKGCDELDHEIMALVESLQKSGAADEGEKLVSELETVSETELEKLKSSICDIVSALPENANEEEEKRAQEALIATLRSSGIAIRERAHSLREWFDEYDGGLGQHVSAIVGSTIEILENIRDLGLQEIGMRWAWMDGVTYKDWAKFHALKKQFSDWQTEVSNTGMQHEAFLEARAIGDRILARGMAVAEKAARELLVIREVGTWKIQAGDNSSDFSIDIIDPAKIRSKLNVPSSIDNASAPITEADGDEMARTEAQATSSSSKVDIDSESAPEPTTSIPQEEAVLPQGTASRVMLEAMSLMSSVVDQAESLEKSSEASASAKFGEVPESVHQSISEDVSKFFSEAVQAASSSLESQEMSVTSPFPKSTQSAQEPLDMGSEPQNAPDINLNEQPLSDPGAASYAEQSPELETSDDKQGGDLPNEDPEPFPDPPVEDKILDDPEPFSGDQIIDNPPPPLDTELAEEPLTFDDSDYSTST